MPHVPFLGHPDQRGINHAFPVRMIVTAGVARDLGTLHPRGAGSEVQVVHRDQNPPLRRLQTVTHIRQRPTDDHAHCVRQVTLLQFIFDRQIQDAALVGIASARLRQRSTVLRKIGTIRVDGQASILSTIWAERDPSAFPHGGGAYHQLQALGQGRGTSPFGRFIQVRQGGERTRGAG